MMDWPSLSVIGCTIAVAALSLAAVHDVAVRTVPNGLAALVGVGALLNAAASQRLGAAMAVAAVLFVACCVLWLRGWLGGGDAKLLTAASPLVAPARTLDLLLAISVAGGVLALPYLPGRRLFARPPAHRPRSLLARLRRCESWRLSRRGPLPYAVAIASGVFLVLIEKG